MYQVEYAIEAISKAGPAIGILAKDGVVLAAEKRINSTLLDVRSATEKLYKIDGHVACAIAGITSDANTLINHCRLEAQRHSYTYQEPVPVEIILTNLCNLKQSYTQFGGLRPFGVSFLIAGWDEHHGFQLYHTDPSGNYAGWKAKPIGANAAQAQALLKDSIKEGDEPLTLQAAMQLSVKALAKTMDSLAPTADKIEVSTISRDADGNVVYKVLEEKELKALIEAVSQDIAEASGKDNAGDI